MIKFINRQLKNKKGFTLVELIVVIAILGVLAAIAVPRLGGFRQTAAEQADKATARTIATAVSALIADGTITATSGKEEIDSDSDIIDFLEGEEAPDPQSTTGEDSFYYEVDTSGNIKVYVGTGDEEKQVYPATE